MIAIEITTHRGEGDKAFAELVKTIERFPRTAAPHVLAAMEQVVTDLFRFQGTLPSASYTANAWEDLDPITVRDRFEEGFRKNTVLVRTGSLQESVIGSGTIIMLGTSAVISLGPDDWRYKTLFAGSERDRLPGRPMVPIGSQGYEATELLVGERTIIPLYEAEIERGVEYGGLIG